MAIATVMVMIWCFLIDKNRRKEIIMFAIAIAVLIVLHCVIKDDLINDYYYNNTKVAMNNLEGQTEKIKGIFTGEGFIIFIKSMIGKWFYLFVGTFMMAWWGAEFLFKLAGAYVKSGWNGIRGHNTVGLSDQSSLWFVWLLLAFGGNFLVAAIYMGIGGRNDMLLYGRYTEYMIGIYFIIGIITFLKDEKWLTKTMLYVFLTIVCGWFCQGILDKNNMTTYQAYHSICTSLFLEKGKSAQGAVLEYAVGGFAVSVFLILILKSKPWKKLKWIKSGIVVLTVAGVYSCIAYNMVYGVMTDKQCLRIANIRNIVSWIEWIDEDGNYPVYYCRDTESRYWSESFQFILNDTPLTVITSDTIIPEEDAFYIVGTDFLWSDGFEQQYYCIKKSSQFAVIVPTDQELANRARKLTGGQK